MQELLYVISDVFSYFSSLKDLDAVSPNLLPLIGVFSIAGAMILTRFTGTIGNLTLPINCSALFIGAMMSNWLLQNAKLPLDSTVEAPLFISIIGMSLASVPMLWWLQGNNAHR